MKWIGLKNYRFVLTDEIFWKAISNTFIYAFFVTLIKNIIGLGLAIILAKRSGSERRFGQPFICR